MDPILNRFGVAMQDREISPRPSPAEVWQSLAVCAVCDSPVELEEPLSFPAPSLPAWPRSCGVNDQRRVMVAALYFRDPFHTRLPFENYCGPACSLAATPRGVGR